MRLSESGSFPNVTAITVGAGAEFDLASTNRVIEARVDLGCYECWLPETGTMIMFR